MQQRVGGFAGCFSAVPPSPHPPPTPSTPPQQNPYKTPPPPLTSTPPSRIWQELAGAVKTELVMEGSEERYALRDIVGLPSEKDLGVENLKVNNGGKGGWLVE